VGASNRDHLGRRRQVPNESQVCSWCGHHFASLAQPALWMALLIAALVAVGLWRRYAWAWWLGIAAAGYQIFRIASAHVHMRGFGHVPGFATLIALALLVLVLVLLLPRTSRRGCNR
jgi:translocator protein